MAFFWKYIDIVPTAVLGLLFLTSWLIWPTPRLDELVKVDGTLLSYSVEASDSWAEKLAAKKHLHVLFKVSGQPGRFWNEALNSHNVKSGVSVSFYVPSHSRLRFINGDARKTYGLTVDGTEIESVEESVFGYSFFQQVLFPPIGILLLWRAVYRAKRKVTGRADHG